MAKPKFKLSKKAKNDADIAIKKRLQAIIKTKKGGTTTKGEKTTARVLNEDKGKLLNDIQSIIDEKNGVLQLDLKVIEYFQYLDEGTTRIKYPWFLTDDLFKDKEFLDAVGELVAKGFEDYAVDILSELEK